MTLEEQLIQIERLVHDIEDEKVDIDTAVENYSKVMKLAAKALTALGKVDKKLQVLKKEGEILLATDFSQ